jgi:endonuclease G, mitochondrial
VMNKKRRMCFFSACNIDGARSKGSQRSTWRYDPRIPEDLQIMKECYGNPPKFSRGHMTRREDPAWGNTASEIQRGSDDSMHVTNATPQMQSFNSPIWLALEDYALQNAREADQKISVFTGPYFKKNDPTMYGVRIPVEFWKVIVFVHDETGELCATGYEMSQEDNLEQPEFVFGDFVSPQLNMSTQVAISTIESKAGISFGELANFDPFAQEGVEDTRRPLLYPEQIRFI